MGDGGLQHRHRAVEPDEVQVQLVGQRDEDPGELLVDPDLGDLPEEDVAGMDVDDQVGPGQALHDGMGDPVGDVAAGGAGEVPVQVGIEDRQRPGQGVEPQGVEGRVEVNPAPKHTRGFGRMAFQPGGQPVADIEPFQFVAVDAGDHGHPRAVASLEGGAPDLQVFAVGHLEGEDGFDGLGDLRHDRKNSRRDLRSGYGDSGGKTSISGAETPLNRKGAKEYSTGMNRIIRMVPDPINRSVTYPGL